MWYEIVKDDEIVDPGLRVEPLVLRRPPRRPRKQIIKTFHEKSSGLGASKNKQKNIVDDLTISRGFAKRISHGSSKLIKFMLR